MKTENLYKENEKRILKKFQEMKDSIFGLYQPFHINFFDYDYENGYRYNKEKAQALILSIIDSCDSRNEAFSIALPKFIEICLMYLLETCNKEDWVYASIIKLSQTLEDCEPGYKSTFDILIEDEADILEEKYGVEFRQLYHEVLANLKGTEFSDFPKFVKSTIEKHIDTNSLNCLYSDSATDDMLSLMDDFSRRVSGRYLYHKRRRQC